MHKGQIHYHVGDFEVPKLHPSAILILTFAVVSSSGVQAQIVINRWLYQYNHSRPHHALGMQAPVSETSIEKTQISGTDSEARQVRQGVLETGTGSSRGISEDKDWFAFRQKRMPINDFQSALSCRTAIFPIHVGKSPEQTFKFEAVDPHRIGAQRTKHRFQFCRLILPRPTRHRRIVLGADIRWLRNEIRLRDRSKMENPQCSDNKNAGVHSVLGAYPAIKRS